MGGAKHILWIMNIRKRYSSIRSEICISKFYISWEKPAFSNGLRKIHSLKMHWFLRPKNLASRCSIFLQLAITMVCCLTLERSVFLLFWTLFYHWKVLNMDYFGWKKKHSSLWNRRLASVLLSLYMVIGHLIHFIRPPCI